MIKEQMFDIKGKEEAICMKNKPFQRVDKPLERAIHVCDEVKERM